MKPILLIIDMQKAMDHPRFGTRNNPNAENIILSLVNGWRRKDWPIIFIQDCSTDPSSPFYPGQYLHDFKDDLKPSQSERVVQKQHQDAFEGTELKRLLSMHSTGGLVITGCHTQHCVRATTETAIKNGYSVLLVEDAIVASSGTRHENSLQAEELHASTLKQLKNLGATVCDSSDILADIDHNDLRALI